MPVTPSDAAAMLARQTLDVFSPSSPTRDATFPENRTIQRYEPTENNSNQADKRRQKQRVEVPRPGGIHFVKRAEIVDDIMADSFAIRQSKTILARSCEAGSVSLCGDEKLTAFVELESAILACGELA